jgi:hypothetical protein
MRSVVFVGLLLCSISNGFAQTQPKDIESELEARLKNRVINLKVFPSGSSLHFNEQRIDGERIIYLSQRRFTAFCDTNGDQPIYRN